MNRLWVRLTLVYFLITLLMVSIPPSIAVLSDNSGGISEIITLVEQGENDQVIAILEENQRGLLRVVFLALVSGGIIGMLVSIRFSRTLVQPLDSLRDAAEKIEEKDFSIRVPVEGTDEFQAVTHSFNSMASQLEKAEELRQNLLSDVAHELRNPMHVIKGNIEAMIDGVFPRSNEELELLLKQTQVITTLVDDLRELAHAEADQLKLNLQSIEISKLLDETVRSYKPAAAEKNITLELALLGKLPVLELDGARIRQVIINLLSNALRYTPEGGKVIISAEHIDEFIEIRVRDNGAGIEPDALPSIFDRFYRTDKARTREKGGTGLGLAIVKALTEAHGGTVQVSSDGVGKGTEFQVRLPGS
ncbi:MAG: HAMP domain-containing sensor histidine kinase [Chloroflexota bacterium]